MHKLRFALTFGAVVLVSASTSCSPSAPLSTAVSTGMGGMDAAAAHQAGPGVEDGGRDTSSGDDATARSGDDATASGGGNTNDAGGSGAAGPDASIDGTAMGAWPAVNDYGARGPLATMHDANTGPGGVYDIFRPTTLGPIPRKNPIISWANGTLFGISSYQMLLDHWASHGFVVIAAHSQSTAGGATHKAGIDWLVAENARGASIYFGFLDTTAIGAAGHSQGGGATIAAGANQPGPTGIVATLPLMPILSFETDKTIVMRQAAPMFNINATMDTRDPTGAVANQIYAGSNRELVQAAFIGIHEDAMSAAMFAPTLAWFRLHLMGDGAAKAMFYPDKTCGLCQNTAWKQVRYKNTPP